MNKQRLLTVGWIVSTGLCIFLQAFAHLAGVNEDIKRWTLRFIMSSLATIFPAILCLCTLQSQLATVQVLASSPYNGEVHIWGFSVSQSSRPPCQRQPKSNLYGLYTCVP